MGGKTGSANSKKMKVGAVIETEDGKKIPAPDSVAAWANPEGVNVLLQKDYAAR